MNRDTLRRCLEREVDEWAAIPAAELEERLKDGCSYQRGEAAGEYQVEAMLLECTPEYLHVSISVDDGGLRAFLPLTQSFLVFRDGRVDR
jgi:hypothetical protein